MLVWDRGAGCVLEAAVGASWGKKAPNVRKTQKRGCWCKAPVPPCVSPWQLEAGIARHIQELSASNDTREPEDVSAGPGRSCCGMEPSRPPPSQPCPAGYAPRALPNAPLLSLQSIIPLMKFLESELQYLNEHLVQENFKR